MDENLSLANRGSIVRDIFRRRQYLPKAMGMLIPPRAMCIQSLAQTLLVRLELLILPFLPRASSPPLNVDATSGATPPYRKGGALGSLECLEAFSLDGLLETRDFPRMSAILLLLRVYPPIFSHLPGCFPASEVSSR